MNEEYGPNIITLTDEEGNDVELEFVDALEWNGVLYRAFFPVVDEEEDAEEAEYGLIIMKPEVDGGEEFLVPVVEDDEYDELYEKFMEQLFEEDQD